MKSLKIFKIRTKFLEWLVNNTATLYLNTIKVHKPKWKCTKADLRSFPTGSLGKELSSFLDDNKIDFIPKAENHDVFHMLIGYKITAVDEIAMQYWLLGNGKWTPYTIGTCIIGAVVIPEYWGVYLKALRKGKKSPAIYDWKFEELLYTNTNKLKSYIHQNAPVYIQQHY